jgi:hypothetical protein
MSEKPKINLPSILLGIGVASVIALISSFTLFNPNQDSENPFLTKIEAKIEGIINKK